MGGFFFDFEPFRDGVAPRRSPSPWASAPTASVPAWPTKPWPSSGTTASSTRRCATTFLRRTTSRTVWKSNCWRPTPSTRLRDGVAIPRHRRDVVPVAASARWRGGSRRSQQDNPTHWLISAQVPDDAEIRKAYRKALAKGLLKVMSKMGISTLQSYKGAQIFEALGLHPDVVETCFSGTPSRIGGASFDAIQRDVVALHDHAWGSETRKRQTDPAGAWTGVNHEDVRSPRFEVPVPSLC